MIGRVTFVIVTVFASWLTVAAGLSLGPPLFIPPYEFDAKFRETHLLKFDLADLSESNSERERKVGIRWIALREGMQQKLSAHAGDSEHIQRLLRSIAKRKSSMDEFYYKTYLLSFPPEPTDADRVSGLKRRKLAIGDWVFCADNAVLASEKFLLALKRDAQADPEWKLDLRAKLIIKQSLDYAEQIRELNVLQCDLARSYEKWNEVLLDFSVKIHAKPDANYEDIERQIGEQRLLTEKLQRRWADAETNNIGIRDAAPWFDATRDSGRTNKRFL